MRKLKPTMDELPCSHAPCGNLSSITVWPRDDQAPLGMGTRSVRGAVPTRSVGTSHRMAAAATIENAAPARKPELCGFDEVRPEATRWIWPGRVAQGWLTLVAGEAAAGKSMVLIDLVSRVSRGDALPRGCQPIDATASTATAPTASAAPASNVLLLTRDGLANVVQPRLAAAGADMKRVQYLRNFPDTDEQGRPVTRGFKIEKDLSAVDETLANEPSIELVVIDACCLALDTRHRGFSEESRQTLLELQELARRRQVAVVVSISIEGQAAGNDLRRRLDKLLAITQHDFVLTVIRDRRRPAQRFLLTLRAALGEMEEGLRFETPDGRIVWGHFGVSASALHASAARLDQLDAARWLQQELLFCPRPVTALRAAAEGAGFAWHVVCRAKAIAGVDGCREGFGPNGRYFWFLQRNGHSRAEDETFWQEHAGGGPEAGDSGPEEAGGRREEAGGGQTSTIGTLTSSATLREQKAAEFTMENKKTGQAAVELLGPVPNDDDEVRVDFGRDIRWLGATGEDAGPPQEARRDTKSSPNRGRPRCSS